MKIVIDPKKCVLCGACAVLTEDAIISDGVKAAYLNPKADLKNKKTRESIMAAVNTCPQKAIKVTS